MIRKLEKIRLEENANTEWIDAFKGLALCGVIAVHSGGSALPGVCGYLAGRGKTWCAIVLFIIGHVDVEVFRALL